MDDEKKQKIVELAVHLKNIYVGLDDEIDQIIRYISPWYLMPELIDQPHIVCLWGMTGTGKTSLVHSIVEFLDFGDRFATSPSTYCLNRLGLREETPYVVLLDEIQTFATKDKDGNRVRSYDSIDWEYLSSGVVASYPWGKVKTYMESETKKTICKPSNSPFDAMDEGMDIEQAIEFYTRLSKKSRLMLPKALVFISGNMDNAYPGANELEDENDADYFYALSKRISLEDIRMSLSRLFFPEHISRFGNNHVIFPSFNREAYESLIRKKISRGLEKIIQKTKRSITINDEVLDHLYKISVVPSQGARPIISTVDSFIGSYILDAICRFEGDIIISIKNNEFCVNGDVVPMPPLVRRTSILDVPLNDIIRLIPHEAAHATIGILMNNVPYSVIIRGKNDASTLFTEMPGASISERRDMICNLLAGREGEFMVFGEYSVGSDEDIIRATDIAAGLARIQLNGGHYKRAEGNMLSMNENSRFDSQIEQILKEETQHAKEMLLSAQGQEIFKELMRTLETKRKIDKKKMDSFVVTKNNLVDKYKNYYGK